MTALNSISGCDDVQESLNAIRDFEQLEELKRRTRGTGVYVSVKCNYYHSEDVMVLSS